MKKEFFFIQFQLIGLLTFVFVFVFVSLQSNALSPQSIFDKDGNRLPDDQANSSRVAWELLSFDRSPEWGGMGLLSQGSFGGGCSATHIDVGGGDEAPVYIVTNGHCLMDGFPQPGEFLIDRAPARGLSFTARFYEDAGNRKIKYLVERIEYATMTGTDLALMRLRGKRIDLRSVGLKGFPIAYDAPIFGEKVANVGIPQSGLWNRYLRKSECQILEVVDLLEGEWRFEASMRNKCSVLGGSSGSSLVSLVTGKIVALINTGVDDRARTPCQENHPCELEKTGSTSSHPEFNYAQRVQELASCFDGQGTFRLNDPQCRLNH